MNMIKNNHWLIHENELAISLIRYYVSIRLIDEDEKNVFLLKVSTGMAEKEISLKFDSMEDAIVFTEDVIDKCSSLDEIKTVYYDTLYDKKKVYRKVR